MLSVLDGSIKDDYTEHLTGFYLLKYGTPQPSLSRQDSTVRSMKYHATLKDQRKRLSGKRAETSDRSVMGKARSSSDGGIEGFSLSPQDEYMEMSPLQQEGNQESSSDESSESSDSYTSMTPLGGEGGKPLPRSQSLDMLVDDSKPRYKACDDYGDEKTKSFTGAQIHSTARKVSPVGHRVSPCLIKAGQKFQEVPLYYTHP